MNVETQATGAGTYTLTVEVPAERVAQKLSEALRQFSRQVVLPGFRQGRVPRALLEAQFGQDFLHEDVQKELIQETLTQALERSSLRPISRPQTRVLEFATGKPFRYEADIEVLPELQFPAPDSIEVEEAPLPEPDEAAVEDVLEDLRVRHATLLPKAADEPAAFEDAAVVRNEEGREREILLSRNSELAQQVVGQRAGQTVQVKLEDQRLELELVALKAVEKPDLGELAAILNQEDAAALRAHVRAELGEQLREEHRRHTRYRVLDALIEKADLPVPPQLKEEALEGELAALERSGRVGRLSEEDRLAYAEGAEQRLRRELALEALKRQLGLSLSDEDFERALAAAAAKREMHPVKFKALLEREGKLARYRRELEDERVLDYLVEHATITPATSSADPQEATP